jgi:predicted ATPase
MEAPAAIRTPDQRIRVFVSSTLKELEPERRAAREVIERMHLAPVMFELGARPHPPRELYRSYLAQSDIFIGLYWERYGWVAPDEEISGLEDEYRLSTRLPSLIYIKDPAPDREERLDALLDRIRSDDRSSYKSFATPDELATLIEGDLATLLAERFDAARPSSAGGATEALSMPDIPAPYTSLVGREADVEAVRAFLADGRNRIVTIVGPGGVGKSRLAIEVAQDAARHGRQVAFALLETVASPDRVVTALARALGVRDTGDEPLEDKVIAAVDESDVLLVVDNMEHLLEAADLLVRLITRTPRLQLLVTSRSPLRVRAERVFDLAPLETPADAEAAASVVSDLSSGFAPAGMSAVALFVQRAEAASPAFRLTAGNVADVIAICRALDGMPLAIELAAARVRTMTPRDILARLDSAFALLVSGARDLPERQRALSRTIQWSVDLLDDDGRAALAALSVFSGSFTLAAAEDVLGAVGIRDPLAAVESLIDASLLSRSTQGGAQLFRLLSLVRAYAHTLGASVSRQAATDAWIAHYRALARTAAAHLRGQDQLEWLTRLEQESENLAGVMRTLLDRGDHDAAAEYAWSQYLFLWIGGYLGLVRDWMTEVLDAAARPDSAVAPLSARSRAIALYYANAPRLWEDLEFDTAPGVRESRDLFRRAGDVAGGALAGVSVALALLARPSGPEIGAATAELTDSLSAFREAGDAWGQAMALVMLGRIDMLGGDMATALGRFEESLTLARAHGERLGVGIALNHRGWAKVMGGDIEGGRDDFATGLDSSLALGHDEGIAYGLEAFVGLKAIQGDAVAAGRLLGAAQALRRRKGILNPGAFEFYMIPLGALREGGRGEDVERGIAEGSALSVTEALHDVRG